MTSEREIAARLQAYRDKLPLFSKDCLRILTKEGKLIPFVFNKTQRYIHKILEDQLKKTGMVRALILKGRQAGGSTYVAARYYHKSSLRSGVSVYILAHEQPASNNLFSIVERFHDHNPVAPDTGTDNAKELEFSRLDSKYTVAVAGIKAAGRSGMNRLFHGSEVAFWTNEKLHFSASVQTVPDLPGTEVILESTANGVTGEFYRMWNEAQKGQSLYIPIFIPWFWTDEYRVKVPEGFVLSKDADEGEISEVEYKRMFGLDMEQMAFRRAKIQLFGGEALFNQEYPATAEMAFINSDSDTFISGKSILLARKAEIEGSGPLIIGADPAGPGGDRFAICARRGHKVEWVDWRNKVGTIDAVAWLRDIVDEHKPAQLNIDAGGLGSAIISAFRSLGPKYDRVCHSINFGSPSQHKRARPHVPGPKNRRAEMWSRMKEWLELEEGVSIPDMDVLQYELACVRRKSTLTNDILLESKDEMRSRGVGSPDVADAMALTFADGTYVEQRQSSDEDNSGPLGQEIGGFDIEPHTPNGWMI